MNGWFSGGMALGIIMDALGRLPSIEFTWTVTGAIWLIVMVIAAMLTSSGLRAPSKWSAFVLSVAGALAGTYALLGHLGHAQPSRAIPELSPVLLSLFGLCILVLLPTLFILFGGMRDRTFHPTFAPVAYLFKLVTFVASTLSIVSFYLQHMQ